MDVNVHPAKREVRFHRPHDIRNLIAEAVEKALRGDPEPPAVMPAQASMQTEGQVTAATTRDENTFSVPALTPASRPSPSAASFSHKVEQQEPLTEDTGESLIAQPVFQLIGPLHDRYIVMEGEEGVVLLDPIAARERVVYEELLQGTQGDGIDSQGLLVPELLELESLDAELVLRHADHFFEAGMAVESFGGSTIQVSSIPSFLKVTDVRKFLLELVDELHDTVGTRRAKAVAFDAFAAGLAKRAGRYESCRIDHSEVLIVAMFVCDLPYCTPDGRPTLIHISLNELDRKFVK